MCCCQFGFGQYWQTAICCALKARRVPKAPLAHKVIFGRALRCFAPAVCCRALAGSPAECHFGRIHGRAYGLVPKSQGERRGPCHRATCRRQLTPPCTVNGRGSILGRAARAALSGRREHGAYSQHPPISRSEWHRPYRTFAFWRVAGCRSIGQGSKTPAIPRRTSRLV